MPLNVRFGQPGRAASTGETDRAYPGADFPFTYGSENDPLTGRTQGLLDRCTPTNSCPKIVHAATALEMWELRQSLGFTDPLGIRDLEEPANVRSYIMASTQHAAAQLPLRASVFCQQQSNPNPHTWTVRALLQALTAWIKNGTEPPPSARPTIAAGTLVAPDQVRFPPIPANNYVGFSRPPTSTFCARSIRLGSTAGSLAFQKIRQLPNHAISVGGHDNDSSCLFRSRPGETVL